MRLSPKHVHPRSDIKAQARARGQSEPQACVRGTCQGARSVTRRPRARATHTARPSTRPMSCVSLCWSVCVSHLVSAIDIDPLPSRSSRKPAQHRLRPHGAASLTPRNTRRRVRSIHPRSSSCLCVCHRGSGPRPERLSATSHHRYLVCLTCRVSLATAGATAGATAAAARP